LRALVADWFDGSYRASTNLTDTYVRNANTVTLPAKKYDAVQANDIAQEIADAAGKIWFITVDGEVFLDIETSTAYAAAISITDAGTDNQTTIFAPGFDTDAADRDKTEVLSGGVAPYGSVRAQGQRATAARSRRPATDGRRCCPSTASTSADATSQLGKLLDVAISSRTSRSAASSTSAPTRSTSSSTARRFSFSGAAAADTSPTTLRIAELTWEEIGKDLYRAHLELARPTKLGSRNKKGKGTPPPVFDDTPDTTTRTGVYLTIDGAPHSAVHVTADSPADGTKTFHFVVSLTDAFGGTPVQQNDPPYTESGSFTVDSAAGDGSGLQIRSGAAILIGPVDLPTNTPIYVWGQYTSSFGGTGYTDGGTDVVFTPAFGGWVPPSDITIVVTPAGSAAGGPGSQMRLCTFELTTVSTPPASGQLVPWEAPQETPDGTTSTFTVSSAVNGYVPGSLRVVVDGQPIVIGLTETDPDRGHVHARLRAVLRRERSRQLHRRLT
jgi:hypothetical protein